ncbi:hypothetical protein, partial [Vibrio rhizosphaerae]|uniref:hypothetical protein n=1 Tax=Vibrio rhizosphaerae TaxID=398736 RepID=UPI0005709FA6
NKKDFLVRLSSLKDELAHRAPMFLKSENRLCVTTQCQRLGKTNRKTVGQYSQYFEITRKKMTNQVLEKYEISLHRTRFAPRPLASIPDATYAAQAPKKTVSGLGTCMTLKGTSMPSCIR